MPQHVNVAEDQLKTKTPAFHNCSNAQSGFLWYDSQNLIKFLFISYTAQSPPRSPPGSPPNNATN